MTRCGTPLDSRYSNANRQRSSKALRRRVNGRSRAPERASQRHRVVVVGELGEVHDFRGEQGLTDGDRLLDGQGPQSEERLPLAHPVCVAAVIMITG
jgi:hypothetical protein